VWPGQRGRYPAVVVGRRLESGTGGHDGVRRRHRPPAGIAQRGPVDLPAVGGVPEQPPRAGRGAEFVSPAHQGQDDWPQGCAESADRPGSPAVTTASRGTPVPSLDAIPKLNDKGRMADIALSPRGQDHRRAARRIVLIGVNRPQSYNRFDPDAFRFPREAGWGNAMRYMLTGDHWRADEAYRMGVVQEVAPGPAAALEAGIELAQKIAACGPLGIKTTLESAHLSIDESEGAAFAKLNEQFGGLFHTEDFIEGRKAEAEGRPPVYQGK
jgi:Enoyl-CoA hydratase/isomerase